MRQYDHLDRRIEPSETRFSVRNSETWINWKAIDENDYWLADHHKPNKRGYWKYLERMDKGRHNGPKRQNGRIITKELNKNLIESLTSQLPLPSSKRFEAIKEFKNLNLGKLGERAELVAYCVSAFVAHENLDAVECHPQTPEEDTHDDFLRVVESLQVTDNQLTRVYGKIDNRLR